MAPLKDPEQLQQIRDALRERGAIGFVRWKQRPAEWLRENLEGQVQESIETAMYDHVEAGRVIDRVPESRERYRDLYEFHFDFRLTIDGRRIHIETTLDVTRTGPIITIVSMHDA